VRPPSILLAALAAVLTLTTLTTLAAPAGASHDPSPPELARSYPGGYQAKGIHHDRIALLTRSCAVDAWTYLQFHHDDSRWRSVKKLQGTGTGCRGRRLVAEFRALHDQELNRWGEQARSYYKPGPHSPTHRVNDLLVYRADPWRPFPPVGHSIRTSAHVDATVIGVGSTRDKCISGWRWAGGDYFRPLC
jgi:hypothetical protein